jgi:hypothetical protein
MKKFLLFFIAVLLMLPVVAKADTYELLFLCDPSLNDENIKDLKWPYDTNAVFEGEEAVCYIYVKNGGLDPLGERVYGMDFTLYNSSRFEASNVWDNTTNDGYTYTLRSKDGVKGDFLVGKSYYSLSGSNSSNRVAILSDISFLIQNDKKYNYYGDKSVVLNSVEESNCSCPACNCPSCPAEKECNCQNTSETENNDDNSNLWLYCSLGANALLLFLLIVALISKKGKKEVKAEEPVVEHVEEPKVEPDETPQEENKEE